MRDVKFDVSHAAKQRLQHPFPSWHVVCFSMNSEMIHPNCRTRLTADDFDFIVRVFGAKGNGAASLHSLLTDHETRDALLEHEVLASAILESPDRISISPHLYFYVLSRRVLRETRVASRDATDYIASLLEAFSRSGCAEPRDPKTQADLRYLSDMLIALNKASSQEAFALRCHIGNYALFISGLFAENIEKRARRGAPDVSFYEQIGVSSFQAAAGHRDAKRLDLEAIYREIAEGFHEARLALNDLARRLLHMDAPVSLPILG